MKLFLLGGQYSAVIPFAVAQIPGNMGPAFRVLPPEIAKPFEINLYVMRYRLKPHGPVAQALWLWQHLIQPASKW